MIRLLLNNQLASQPLTPAVFSGSRLSVHLAGTVCRHQTLNNSKLKIRNGFMNIHIMLNNETPYEKTAQSLARVMSLAQQPGALKSPT